MSRLTKAESARSNGAKSRGPITPEGKARSSQNAIRHALAAQSIPLSNESQPRCHAMLEAYFDELQPVGIVEEDLVEEMVDAKWRQRRAIAMANADLDFRMQDDADALDREFKNMDGEIRQLFAMKKVTHDDPNLVATLHRYEVSARRAYHKALQTLLQLQAIRKSEDREPEPSTKPSHPTGPQLVTKLQNEPTAPSPSPRDKEQS